MRTAAIVVVLGLLVVTGPSVARVSTHDQYRTWRWHHVRVDAPFQGLQKEIEELQARVDALSGSGNNTTTTLVVVDSTGATMGRVLGVSTGLHNTVAGFESNGEVYPFDVQRNDYAGSLLYFTSSDCTGQAYAVPTYTPFPATALSTPDDVLYGESGPSQIVTLHSLKSGASCYAAGSSMTLVPVDPVANLGTMFVPPFSVKAE